MAVISANFASRKIVSCIYLGDPNGAAPRKGPFKAEIIQLSSASPRQPFASSAELLFALGPTDLEGRWPRGDEQDLDGDRRTDRGASAGADVGADP